jgi:purine-binding chemotaxis protein CheW
MSARRETGPSSVDAGESLKLVGFRIDDWRFAVRLEQVQTSLMPCEITRVFHTPDFIRGIISLRGTIVCVLELGRLLGMGGSPRPHHRFLVVSHGGVQAAIPVHDVFRVPEIPAGAVEPLPPSLDASQRTLLEGVINMSSLPEADAVAGMDTLTLVDARTLFEAPEVVSLRSRR